MAEATVIEKVFGNGEITRKPRQSVDMAFGRFQPANAVGDGAPAPRDLNRADVGVSGGFPYRADGLRVTAAFKVGDSREGFDGQPVLFEIRFKFGAGSGGVSSAGCHSEGCGGQNGKKDFLQSSISTSISDSHKPRPLGLVSRVTRLIESVSASVKTWRRTFLSFDHTWRYPMKRGISGFRVTARVLGNGSVTGGSESGQLGKR